MLPLLSGSLFHVHYALSQKLNARLQNLHDMRTQDINRQTYTKFKRMPRETQLASFSGIFAYFHLAFVLSRQTSDRSLASMWSCLKLTDCAMRLIPNLPAVFVCTLASMTCLTAALEFVLGTVSASSAATASTEEEEVGERAGMLFRTPAQLDGVRKFIACGLTLLSAPASQVCIVPYRF